MQTQASGTGLSGPFILATDVVDHEVAGQMPGAYALGYIDNVGRFCITYVGSSQSNLNAKLKEHVGTAQYFKFRHLPSEKASFEKECKLFHEFLPIGNFLHPARPPGRDWNCPYCQVNRFSR